MNSVLIVTACPDRRRALARGFARHGWRVDAFDCLTSALDALPEISPQLAVIERESGAESDLQLLDAIRTRCERVPPYFNSGTINLE